MDLNHLLIEIIDNKYNELKIGSHLPEEIFWKIKSFEGNAIGQIGETFVKKVFIDNNLPMDDDANAIIHDEYDIKTGNIKIEIKTARKGKNNNSFQFNGINPIYNHTYIILIGITPTSVLYKIISGKDIYNHKNRKHYLDIGDNCLKPLVAMHPGTNVDYKLTLTLKNLKSIDTFVDDLKSILNKV